MKAFLKDLFSYKGRWNRLKFWLYPLAIQLPILALVIWSISTVSFNWYVQQAMEAKVTAIESQLETIATGWLEQDTSLLQQELEETRAMLADAPSQDANSIGTITMLIIWLLYIIGIYIQVVTYIKRFHDLWRSGWYSLLMFIPFISIIGLIWAWFFKWTVGPNKYGPDPLGWVAAPSSSEEL